MEMMKMMKKITLVSALAISVSLIQSCDDSSDDNNPITNEAQANFEMRAVTTQSNLSPVEGRVTATGYTFTEVIAGVTEIELETLEEKNQEAANGYEDEDDEIEFEGNFIVNLLTGTSDPDFGLSEILPGIYEEVEVSFENILEDNNSLIAKFYKVTDGSPDTTFVEFATEEEFEIEIEDDEEGFVLDNGTITSIFVTLDLDVLFGAIDLNSLIPDQDGVIRINEDSNSEVMENIIDKLEEALDSYDEDYDDDDNDDD